MNRLALLFVGFWMSISAGTAQPTGYPFRTLTDFRKALERITGIPDPPERIQHTDILWKQLVEAGQVPFKSGDSVALLYKGEAQSVSWAGDFNGWKPDLPGFRGVQSGFSDIWIAVLRLPADARTDYKIVVDGNWILDPANPAVQWSGMGPNSELRMPDCRIPLETIPAEGVIRGSLSENKLIKSQILGYPVQYKVYLPYHYASHENLPVVYVTDGHEYADDKKGALVTILDNLIFQEEIRPVVAVFIDPRDPQNEDQNRRMREYVCNRKFADFLCEELVPRVDSQYRTHACPDDRAILGTSLGGMNSAWVGAVRINYFHLLGIQSPAFNKQVLDTFASCEWFPFRVYMTTGVLNDTQKQALAMKDILDKNSVPYVYREVNQGHSWGNWRGELADMMRWFFGN